MTITNGQKIVKNNYFFDCNSTKIHKKHKNIKNTKKAIFDIFLGNIYKFTYTNLEIMNEKPAV
jgi:hypothetical protein